MRGKHSGGGPTAEPTNHKSEDGAAQHTQESQAEGEGSSSPHLVSSRMSLDLFCFGVITALSADWIPALSSFGLVQKVHPVYFESEKMHTLWAILAKACSCPT